MRSASRLVMVGRTALVALALLVPSGMDQHGKLAAALVARRLPPLRAANAAPHSAARAALHPPRPLVHALALSSRCSEVCCAAEGSLPAGSSRPPSRSPQQRLLARKQQLDQLRTRLSDRLREQLRVNASRMPAWARRLVRAVRLALPAIALMLVFLNVAGSRSRSAASALVELPYSSFLSIVKNEPSRVSQLRLSLSRISFMLDGESNTFVRPVRAAPELLSLLASSGVEFRAAAASGGAALLPLVFPLLWGVMLFSLVRRQFNGATGSVGKRAGGSGTRISAEELSFDDVAGLDMARNEVQEVVSMLKMPERYAAAGARLPAGVLMVGPPGTGKTLLARVMAAQAGVPFFYCSGSDFVELFIGRGAARMRSLFKEAGEVAPSVIFVDELDALGKQRSLKIGGANDEVEQTLNQMLACMDGLDSSNNGVVVMGATNRLEILDPALTRPGRFDRLVRIELPDAEGREDILRVHTRAMNLADDVDLARIGAAALTFSGAELAALANEAAIRSVRRNGGEVNMEDFLSALIDFTTSRKRGASGLLEKIFKTAAP